MSDQVTIKKVNEVIKAGAKARGLTYAQIAKRLGVSEPTVKRWFRGEGISIQQWLNMIGVVGVSMTDVAIALDEPFLDQFEYTERQEKTLAETNGLLAFFQLLLSGHTANEIIKGYAITKATVSSHLKLLDDIGLIEWTTGTSCKLKVHGEPKWRKNGPLAKKFRDQLFSEFIWPRRNESNFRLGIYEIVESDQKEIESHLSKAFEVAKNLEKKARILKLKTKTVCIGTCLDQHSPKFLNLVPSRE